MVFGETSFASEFCFELKGCVLLNFVFFLCVKVGEGKN